MSPSPRREPIGPVVAVSALTEGISGNRRLGDTTFAPTLDPPADCRLSTQEIFGPAIAVYGYDDLGEER